MKIRDKLFGGEYDFLPKKKNHKIGSLFPSDGSFTFNGRSAFYLIVKKLKEKKVRCIYVPYLICESLTEVLKKEKISIKYYDIDKKFNEKLSKIKKNCALLKIHYFGLRKSKSLNTLLKNKKLLIIEDFSHYMPDKKNLEGNQSFKFMSLRKLGLCPIGGWTNVSEKKKIRKLNKFKEFIDLKIKKTRYLDNELKNRNLKIEISYIKKFQQIEKLFSNNYKLGTISKERMEQLISDVLHYSRVDIEASKETDIDLNLIVEDIISVLYIPSHVTVKVNQVLPFIKGDKTKLQQVFLNLITNAIKFSDKSKGLIEIDFSTKKNHYEFSIKDNGIGIDKKYHDKIFKIFHTLNRNKDSTGIGLSIVKKIVGLHGGDIWLESELKKGATFYFTLKK